MMKRLLSMAAIAVAVAASGTELKDLKLKAKTDKANPIDYKVGETIRFDFFLDGVAELPSEAKEPLYVIWKREGDDGITVVGTNGISLAKGCSMETSLSVPGIIRVDAQLVGNDYKMFDSVQRTRNDKGIGVRGGAGAETEKMKLSTKEPEDFDAFWAEAKAKLAAIPVKAKRIEATPDKLKGRIKVYAVEIDCFGPRPATGWLFIPENAKERSLPACAQFDGYNGNEFKVPQVPEWIPTNRITLCLNAHGYEMVGHDEQYYKDYGDKVNGVAPGAPKRMMYALEPSDYDNPRETYFYYMAMRVMRAYDYLKTLPEWDGKNLEASGGSQGGLQTMWAAGLVDGLTAARPEVTWGCDLGNSLREGGPLISNTWGIPHADGAFYFDAALHAKRVPATCKVEITRLGLGDLACPPRGVLLSYYNMKCPVSAKLVQGSTHGYVPPAPNQTFTISKLATFTAAFAAPVAAEETFPVEGKMLVGVNFWGSKAGIRMWRADEWDEASIEKDIAALAANGVELMRVFPTWSEFQPIRQEKKFQGAPALILRDGTDEEIYDPLWLDPGAVARFEKFCEIAERHNVKLMVSLVTGWMSGTLFAPRIVENRNLITDPEAVMWEGRFARAFVRRMKGKKAIVAWCLGNESNCMGAADSRAQAWMWLNTISSAIRMEDPSRPVVSGMHSQTSDGFGPQRGDYNKWTLQMQGELLDLLTPHPYPAAFRVEANRGPFNCFRNALHPVSQCLFYSAVSGKPSFPQEIGSLGPRMSPDWMSAKGMRQQMFTCWAHGLGAYLWWCAFMQTHLDYAPYTACHMEPELGLLNADEGRTPKPMAKELKAFRDFRDSLPFDALPKYKTDAVCLVSEREDFYHQTFGAFMLSKAAGFDLEFVGADSRELPEANFYILPSGKGWGTYSRKTWDELVARVKKGATLLVSRGFETGYIDWLDITGLEQTTYHKWRKESFEFEGRKMSFADSYTAEQKPIDCEVVAKDSSGNVVVSLKRLGKGKVIVVNFALEKCIVEQESEVVDNGFSNELWRIYAYAAREAGVKRLVTKDDPRLVITEHPRTDGTTLVVAVNTYDTPVAFPVKVAGKVGRVWNGEWGTGNVSPERSEPRKRSLEGWERGTISIRENDGCIFEVTNGN